MRKITKARVDACKPDTKGEYMIWDEDLPGFGLRVFPSGKKTYFVQYRIAGRTRRFKLGFHSFLTPDEARKAAKKALGEVANGVDPAQEVRRLRNDITVAALCDRYLADGCATKKASTLATDRGRIDRHVRPLLGTRTVLSIQTADIEKFLKDVAQGKTKADVKTKARGRARVTGGKGTATRTVGLLGAIFSYAQSAGLRSDNPVRGVKRYKDRRMERFLRADELRRLGDALDRAAERESTMALDAIRLLALTGCRKNEVLSLRWTDINWTANCLVLPDSKTGHKIVPLGQAALALLHVMRPKKLEGYVFVGHQGDHFKGLQKVWERVRADADLGDLRLHDLRHTFISIGVNSGLGLPVIGHVVGHRSIETTMKYVHLETGAGHGAADRVSTIVAASLTHNAEA